MIVINVLDQGIFITVISVYAPEYGLDDDQKCNFYDSLLMLLQSLERRTSMVKFDQSWKAFNIKFWSHWEDRKWVFNMEKQPSRGAIIKMRPEKYHPTKSTGEHPCQNATPTTPPCSFIEVALQRGPFNTNKSSKALSKRAPPKDSTRLYSKIQINLR